jgi:YVTN family beta-propeller protein
LKKSIAINHSGPNHADFSLDGRYMWVSCEFSGWLVKVDLQQGKEIAELNLGGAPIDVKFSPDMSVLYVANQDRGGVSVVDPNTMQELEFIDTGAGAHGLYPSRDASVLYVSNRQGGSISLISFATRKVVATWKIPGGGSPDMGSVSADGKQLWLAGRFSDEVYVFDTTNGNLLARIKTGRSPHGLTLVPQPGRFSLGHTGNYR